VFGIDPATLSRDYELHEVIALAKAANRFLVNMEQLRSVQRMIPAQIPVSASQSPDTDGFRQAFGNHYKTSLD